MLDDVNIDLDGVIYDFIRKLAEMDGYSYCGNWYGMIEKSGMSFQQYIKQRISYHHRNGLFRDGDILMDGAKLLRDMFKYREKYGFKIKILSTVGNTNNYLSSESVEQITNDKIIWLKNTILDNDVIYNKVDDVIITNTSHDKLLHVNDNSILIDDHMGTEKRFREANKNFILHRNYIDTMTEFQLYL